MPITRKDKRDRAQDELAVLDGVIEYADRMIYEQQRHEYHPLRRHAYGKTVVIETENEGILTFRLSSTPVVYPNRASGYATPHSPVGRLCSILQPGDEDESPRWGWYQVREIRLFDRFDGPLFEPNVRNFLHMDVDSESGKAKVTDLQSFLAGVPAPEEEVPEPEPVSEAVEALPPVTEEIPLEPPEIPQAEQLVVETIEVVEEEEGAAGTGVVYEEDESETEGAAPTVEEYFGLSETFYVNRTREQDEVMSRSPIGPMFVEGVAGSGKTSAALGRTKMLCDFNANNVYEEAEFREIAGENLAYWAGQFAGQFSQEGSVGFVRTGELIQYLKETCRRLDLPNLPVQEYPELRSRLRQHRRVDRGRKGMKRWTGLGEPRGTHPDTTIEWLKSADRAIGGYFADSFLDGLPTAEKIAGAFIPRHQDRARRMASVATDRLRAEVFQLAQELKKSSKGGGFALDSLAVRVRDRIQRVRKDVLGRDVLWVTIEERSWTAPRERDLAHQLVTDKAQLYLRSSARLVFVNENDLVDDSLELLSTTGEPLVWSEETQALLEEGSVLVRDTSGRTLRAMKSDSSDLYLRLLPEATNKPYVFVEGRLRPLNLARGLGRERLRLSLLPSAQSSADEDAEADGRQADQQTVDEPQRHRSVDSVFSGLVRLGLMQVLTYLADAYASVLAVHQSQFPDPGLAKQISEQLSQRQLAEEDIDLLLCLAHLVGRGFSETPQALSEPPLYQAVFVDEVQDFTEQQVFLMVEQARPEYRAVTVVGDIAQKLHYGSRIDILGCFPGRNVPHVKLVENMRQLDAPGLAWFSACFRAELQDGLTGYEPSETLAARMREHADRLRGPDWILVDDDEELTEHVVETLRTMQRHQTAAVILNDPEAAAAFHDRCRNVLTAEMVDAELSERIDLSRRHVRHFTSVTHAKGLEFDVVIVPYLERYDLADPTHVNRLYVALTRSRRKLVLLSHASRPTSAFDSVWERYENTVARI